VNLLMAGLQGLMANDQVRAVVLALSAPIDRLSNREPAEGEQRSRAHRA
jgi:hypothetical protein